MIRHHLSVLLIDEPPKGQESLGKSLTQMGINVVGQSPYGRRIVGALEKVDCDVILVGLRDPVYRSLRAIEIASLASPGAPVVAFVDRRSSALFELGRKAMQSGARDLLPMPLPANELNNALWKAVLSEDRRMLARKGGTEEVLPLGEVILILGAKGGIGKTTLAVNLAAALVSLSDEKVSIIDLDSTAGGVTAMLGIDNRTGILDALEILEREAEEDLTKFVPRPYRDLAVLGITDRRGRAAAVEPEKVVGVLETLARTYDYVFVDSPPVWTEVLAAAAEVATLVLFVVTPEFGCIANTKTIMEQALTIPFFKDKTKLILNHHDIPGGLKRGEIEQALELPITWQVPDDAKAMVAAQLGMPIVDAYPNAKAAQSFYNLLYTVTGVRKPQQGFFARLFKRAKKMKPEGSLGEVLEGTDQLASVGASAVESSEGS